MAAMTMGAHLFYDIPLVLLSVVVAATLATLSLFALFFLRGNPRLRRVRLPISALIMGCAVAGMHYTAMAAALFIPAEMTHTHESLDSTILSILITVFVAFLFSDVFAVVFASQQILTKRTLEKEVLNRQLAESAAIAEKARLQTIFDNTVDGIILIDDKGMIREWNAAARRIFGYDIGQVAGRNISILMSESTRSSIEAVFRGDMENELNRFAGIGRTLVGLRRDGSEFPMDLSVGEAREGGEHIFVGLVRDLSEHAQAEAQLNAALGSMSGGLLVLDAAMTVAVCNDRFRELYDLPIEICGIGTQWRDCLYYRACRNEFGEGDPRALADEAIDRIKTKTPYHRESIIGKRVVEAHWSVVAGGGYVAVATDITEATELAEALREAQVLAESANQAKSNFLAVMSHEIRTPMNSVIGMIDVMREGELSEDQREIADVIRDSSFSLLQIINDILDFSKIEATGVQLDRSPVSILQMTEGVCDALSWTARQREIKLVLSFGNYDLHPVYGDALRLRQILINLIGNAIKFTETTAERIGVVRLSVDTFEAGNGMKRIRFKISDNGIGMDEKARRALFLPFSQAESSTTRKYGGTGLGLSIVARLVDAMNGTIEVKSEIGTGSTFIVEILAEPAPMGGPSQVTLPDLKGIRAKVAAANGENRDTALKILRLLGAEASEIQFDDAIESGTTGIWTADMGGRPISIVVVDDETDSLRPGLRRMASEQDAIVRFVSIRSDRRSDDDHSPDTVSVDASPLKLTTFARAAAIAAGRSSPVPSRQLSNERGLIPNAPNREDAIRMGTLVLVVEDNRNNQQVIMRQLSLLGYAYDVASNGVDALALLAERPYGIVLTDCHMPQMDGFELTRQIRLSERGTGRHQKIIATTANALQGEAEHCIASGMDFYLSKPLELSKLAETLKTWLPINRDGAVATDPELEGRSRSATPVDISAIAQVYGSDDPELVLIALRDFLELSVSDADAFAAAVRENDRHAIRELGHKLKSTAKCVGAYALVSACEKAEAMAFSASGDGQAIFEKVMPEFRRVYLFAEDYVAKAPVAAV
jgi:PAS domain S-box-containing protein